MTAASAPSRRKVSNLKRPSQPDSRPLSASVRRGAFWSVATSLLLRVASIFVTAVIARILDPRDFGVFAVALTAYTIVSSVGEFGVSSCLIRADLDLDSLAPTMAAVSVATSAILAGAMTVFAVPIAGALGSAAAAGPIRVMALTVILNGVFAVPTAQLTRDFKQDKLFLANAISFVPSTVLLILLAKSGSGAMAFAWSRVVGQFVSGCVVFAAVPKVYRPGVARSAMSVLFMFGLPLAGANFVNYILVNVDYALIGHLMGAVPLGIYVLAFNVASWPASLFSTMLYSVALPAFSRVKHDADLLKNAIGSAMGALSIVVIPICALTMALARPLVLTLYGAKWATSADVLSVLSLYGAISMICSLFANIVASLGRTRSILVIQLIWLAALFPAMVIGLRRDGIVGASVAHVIVIGPIVLPIYLFVLRRTTQVRIAALAKAMLPALLASSAAALAARATASQFTDPLAELITGLAAGGLIYIMAATPQVIALLTRGQAPNVRAMRVLRLYHNVGRLAGLPVSGRAKHSVKNMQSVKNDKRCKQGAPEIAGVSSSNVDLVIGPDPGVRMQPLSFGPMHCDWAWRD